MSCCNPDSTKVCAFTKVPANKKTFPWLPAINQEGCSKPLVESLRKNVKFAILLTSLLSILVNLFSAVVYRYFWTNLEFVKETDDEFNKNELTPAYLLTYNRNFFSKKISVVMWCPYPRIFSQIVIIKKLISYYL